MAKITYKPGLRVLEFVRGEKLPKTDTTPPMPPVHEPRPWYWNGAKGFYKERRTDLWVPVKIKRQDHGVDFWTWGMCKELEGYSKETYDRGEYFLYEEDLHDPSVFRFTK